jgi:hypothetical protein
MDIKYPVPKLFSPVPGPFGAGPKVAVMYRDVNGTTVVRPEWALLC